MLNSNSWLAVFMITDVFGTEGRFNVPGAVSEGNWSYRLDKTVAELDKDPHLLHKTQMFAKLVKESRRMPVSWFGRPNLDRSQHFFRMARGLSLCGRVS